MSKLHRNRSMATGRDAARGARTGALLREAREAKGITLADVAATTRVSEGFLAGLEAGEIAEDLAPLYALGYARAYARTIGIPEDLAVRQVREVMSNRKPRRARSRGSKGGRSGPRFLRIGIEWWLGALGVALVAGVLLLLLKFTRL